MMQKRVILDTSPLVALINKKDNTHEWAKQQWSQIKPPLLTCESVITESFFLLRNIYGGEAAVIRLLERKVIKIAFDLEREIESLKDLLIRYKSVPVSLGNLEKFKSYSKLQRILVVSAFKIAQNSN